MDLRKKPVKTKNCLVIPVFERLSEYFIVHTTFSKIKDPMPEDILDQYNETILAQNTAGVKEYIENYCKENYSEYKFKQEQNGYQSDQVNGKNIWVMFEELKKSSIDKIVIPNNF